MEKIEFKPLGKALNVIASTKLEVTYNYDDLIFVEHSPFLIRFDKKDENLLHLHFNKDCEKSEADKLELILMNSAKLEGIKIKNSGKFVLSAVEESEELKIEFLS